MNVKLRHSQLATSRAPVLILESPYHPEFPALAQKIGGRWDGAQWRFDPRDEERVADLCERVFGINPLGPPPELLTIQTVIPMTEALDDRLWGFGRLLVRRRAADDDIWLGAGVIIVDGEFATTGGSRREPAIGRPLTPVNLEVRDVPASLLAREKRSYAIIEDRRGADRDVDRRVSLIVEQARDLPPAGRAVLLLRLREIAILEDR